MSKLKNKVLKRKEGITLVALIITIIILLILAGITINTLSNSGIFEKAKEARDTYRNAQNEEETQIAKYSNEIDSYVGGNRDMKATLLWTNPNPSSPFNNQTINLDLSSYKYIVITIIGNTNSNSDENYPNCTTIIPVSDIVPQNDYCMVGQKSTAPRRCYATSTGVVFSGNDNNERAIPRFIYGITSDLGIKLDK